MSPEIGDHPAITRALIGDPTEGDDRIYCRECDTIIDASNTCQAEGVIPDRPQCDDCCDCEAHREEADTRYRTYPGQREAA